MNVPILVLLVLSILFALTLWVVLVLHLTSKPLDDPEQEAFRLAIRRDIRRLICFWRRP